MFDTIRQQMKTMEEFLATLGYDTVQVHSLTVRESYIDLTFSAKDDFQDDIPHTLRYKRFSWDMFSGDDLNEIWSQLYALPSRATRELHVLANQLSGIAGMESQLRNVRIQQMIGPILEAREEMKKLLVAPSEVLEPIATHLDDEIPY